MNISLRRIIVLLCALLVSGIACPAFADKYGDEAVDIVNQLQDIVNNRYSELISKDDAVYSKVKDLAKRSEDLIVACPLDHPIAEVAKNIKNQSLRVLSWAKDTYNGKVSRESKSMMSEDLAKLKADLRKAGG
jgi:hypothetical protein